MNRPLIGISAIVENDKNEILLGRRINIKGEGLWATPGGHLELNETWEECTKREVKEETNLEIKDFVFLDAFNVIEDNHHYVEIYTYSRLAGGILKNMEPEKCEGWYWFNWTQPPSPLYSSLHYVIPRLSNFLYMIANTRKLAMDSCAKEYPHKLSRNNQLILKGES